MKSISYISIVLLFIFNLILVYKISGLKDKNAKLNVFINTSKQNLRSKTAVIDNISNRVIENHLINNVRLNTESIKLMNTDNNYISLKNLITKKDKIIVYRLPSEICSPCVSQTLHEIKKQKKYYNSIIIVLFNKFQLQNKKYDLSEIDIETFLLKERLPLSADYKSKGYFFSIDNREITKDGYIPIVNNSDFVGNYINKIIDLNVY